MKSISKRGVSEFCAWQLSMSTLNSDMHGILPLTPGQMTSRTSHKAGLLQWNEFSTISLLHNWVCLGGIFATHRRPSQGPYTIPWHNGQRPSPMYCLAFKSFQHCRDFHAILAALGIHVDGKVPKKAHERRSTRIIAPPPPPSLVPPAAEIF